MKKIQFLFFFAFLGSVVYIVLSSNQDVRYHRKYGVLPEFLFMMGRSFPDEPGAKKPFSSEFLAMFFDSSEELETQPIAAESIGATVSSEEAKDPFSPVIIVLPNTFAVESNDPLLPDVVASLPLEIEEKNAERILPGAEAALSKANVEEDQKESLMHDVAEALPQNFGSVEAYQPILPDVAASLPIKTREPIAPRTIVLPEDLGNEPVETEVVSSESVDESFVSSVLASLPTEEREQNDPILSEVVDALPLELGREVATSPEEFQAEREPFIPEVVAALPNDLGKERDSMLPQALASLPKEQSSRETEEASRPILADVLAALSAPNRAEIASNEPKEPILPDVITSLEEPSLCRTESYVHQNEEIRGIVLLGANTPLLTDEELKNVKLLTVRNLTVPGGAKSLSKRIYDKFFGEELDSQIIFSVKAEVVSYYEEENHPFVEVQIPNQDITQGVLQLIVSESHVGEIDVEGGRFTPPAKLKGYLTAKPDGPIDLGQLRKNVNFMNRNPFRRVDVIYGPGEKPYTTDISLIVEDRRPTRFYTGFDNTGVETTDRQRFFGGINWEFGFDHLFTYQFTSTYKVSQFQAHTLQYTALLPWSHSLSIFGGYSKIYAKLPFPSTHNKGNSYQASFRYTIPFIPGQQFSHEFTFGGDFKRTNNTIEYSELFTNVAQPVNLTQVMGQYSGAWEGKQFRIDFDTELYWSPGEWIGDQSNAEFNQLRPDAKHQWVYVKGAVKYLQQMPRGWSFFFFGSGQISSQNLLPSEQIGIGGHDTVRGYDERQLNYDGGFIVNGEIRTPAFPLLARRSKNPGRDALQFLVFVDFGYGEDHNAIAGNPNGDYLFGTGPGLRYTLNPWLTGRFDWGIKLHKQAIFTGGDSMVHFSVNMNI